MGLPRGAPVATRWGKARRLRGRRCRALPHRVGQCLRRETPQDRDVSARSSVADYARTRSSGPSMAGDPSCWTSPRNASRAPTSSAHLPSRRADQALHRSGATFISSFDTCAAALRPDEQEVTVHRMLEVCRLLKEPAAQAG